MIVVRKSDERGRAEHGWLHSRHTFSFGSYYHPEHMGWGPLRVINEDVVEAGGGFDTHPHRDMEIISYVVRGKLAHKDSTGSGGVLVPGDVQVMSAGRGILHSEFNGSQEESAHFLQIWITPKERGLPPRHEQRSFERGAAMTLLVSGDGREGSLQIAQDALLYSVGGDESSAPVSYPILKGRRAWLQVVKGRFSIGDEQLSEGDGAGVIDEQLEIRFESHSELLLFDLPE